MTINDALHNAARRYLMDRNVELKTFIYEIEAWGVETNELTLHPRTALLDTMLESVEALVPAGEDPDVFCAIIVETGFSADDLITQSKSWVRNGLREATQIERERFAERVLSWSVAEMSGEAPMPFRRCVLQEERDVLWGRLQQRWKVGGNYWLPWSDAQLDDEVLAVHADALGQFVGSEALREIMRGGGVSHVFEIWEHGEEQDYELLVEQVVVSSAWGEQFWFSDKMDWIIYTTHEGSAALAGDWLLTAVKAAWPTWAKHLFQRQRPLTPYERSKLDEIREDPTDVRDHVLLLRACGSSDLDEIASLLNNGADINSSTLRRGTALHAAAVRGKVSSVRLLIERGADVDALAGLGGTPLIAGVSGGHVEVVELLLAAGADVNARVEPSEQDRRVGLTALEIAEASPYLEALGGDRRLKIIALLRNAGAR